MVTTEATLVRSPRRTSDHSYQLGAFPSYRQAERVMERLTDVGFPVERARVVSAGGHRADQASRHPSTGRVTVVGAGLGAWLGLLAGVIVALFVAGAQWPAMIGGGLAIGAAAGAALALAAHWATGHHPDFADATDRQRRYVVEVDSTHAVEAVQALDRS